MEKLHRQFVDGCLRQPGMTEEIAEELFRQVAAFASLRVRQVARGRVRADGLRIVVPQALLSGAVPRRAHQRPADGLLPGGGARQRHEAPRGGGAAGGHQRVRRTRRRPSGWAGPGEPLPAGAGIAARPEPIRSPACVIPSRGVARALDPRGDRGLGRPAGAPPGEGDRRAARRAARRRSWPAARTARSRTSSSGPGCPRRSSSG